MASTAPTLTLEPCDLSTVQRASVNVNPGVPSKLDLTSHSTAPHAHSRSAPSSPKHRVSACPFAFALSSSASASSCPFARLAPSRTAVVRTERAAAVEQTGTDEVTERALVVHTPRRCPLWVRVLRFSAKYIAKQVVIRTFKSTLFRFFAAIRK